MFRAILFSFFLGVMFSERVRQLGDDAQAAILPSLRTMLSVDAYERLAAALS